MRFDFYDLDVQTCAIRIKKCDGKNPPNPAILISVLLTVLILDGNSDHVAHT